MLGVHGVLEKNIKQATARQYDKCTWRKGGGENRKNERVEGSGEDMARPRMLPQSLPASWSPLWGLRGWRWSPSVAFRGGALGWWLGLDKIIRWSPMIGYSGFIRREKAEDTHMPTLPVFHHVFHLRLLGTLPSRRPSPGATTQPWIRTVSQNKSIPSLSYFVISNRKWTKTALPPMTQ